MSETGPVTQRVVPPAIIEARRRQEPFLARPQVVGLMVAGALALVVTAMFTMAELSSRVGSQSGRLHAQDLVAIRIDTVRHQLGAATILRDADRPAANDNIEVARATLSELASIEASGMELVSAELAGFVEAGRALATALEQDVGSDQLNDQFQAFAMTHESLAERLSIDQAESVDAVNSTIRLLSRFGALGGGLLAFVVPLSALYVQRRVGQRRLSSYEFDADLRWLLTANELDKANIRAELQQCLDELSTAPELAEPRLRTLIDRLDLASVESVSNPEPIDVVDLFASRPAFPGLRRSVESEDQPICHTDPTILSAAFTSIEWAASQAGADELVLAVGDADGSWQQVEIRGEGGIEAHDLAEVVGPLRSIETALASTGLPVENDQQTLRWVIDFPLAEPDDQLASTRTKGTQSATETTAK